MKSFNVLVISKGFVSLGCNLLFLIYENYKTNLKICSTLNSETYIQLYDAHVLYIHSTITSDFKLLLIFLYYTIVLSAQTCTLPTLLQKCLHSTRSFLKIKANLTEIRGV